MRLCLITTCVIGLETAGDPNAAAALLHLTAALGHVVVRWPNAPYPDFGRLPIYASLKSSGRDGEANLRFGCDFIKGHLLSSRDLPLPRS